MSGLHLAGLASNLAFIAWGWCFSQFTTERGILSAFSFVTATHRQIAIVSTKFATIFVSDKQIGPEKAAAALRAASSMAQARPLPGTLGHRMLEPKQLTFL